LNQKGLFLRRKSPFYVLLRKTLIEYPESNTAAINNCTDTRSTEKATTTPLNYQLALHLILPDDKKALLR